MPFPRLPPGAAHQAAAPLPLLLPFHCPPSHSMTGGNVSNRIKEQYPWGRYRWLDSLLGLPVKRQRLFLSHRLATSPLSNALGCLVFLGTPFYVKKWERNGVRRLVLATVASIVVMLAVMWGYAMLVSYAIRSAVAKRSLDAPYLTPLIASALILVFATISVSIEVSRSTAFYSGNIYHSPDFDWSHAMSALVVHAGKLDEASLALSSEPIARAYVFPHLANMLKLPFWKPLPQFPPHDAVPLDWLLYIASFGRILLWNIIFILPALILSLLSHIVAPLVIGAVRNVIVVISFGLAQNELSFAHVFMDEILDLGLSSQHVEHWNVQKLLALAKTRSLQGELMAGYEDDTCDMGEAVFEEGLLKERARGEGLLGGGLSEEGAPGTTVDGTSGEGTKGEGTVAKGDKGNGGMDSGREGEVEGWSNGRGVQQVSSAVGGAGSAAGHKVAESVGAAAPVASPQEAAVAGAAAVAGDNGSGEEKDKESRYRPILEPSFSASAGQWQRSASRLRRRVTFKSARTLGDDTREDETRADETHGDETRGHVTPRDVTPDRPLLPLSTSQDSSYSSDPSHSHSHTRTQGERHQSMQPAGKEVQASRSNNKVTFEAPRKQVGRGKEEQESRTKNSDVFKGEEYDGEAESLGCAMGSVKESTMKGKKHGEEQLLYEYLWDDKELNEAATKCLTYQCLEPGIKKMWRNPRLTPEAFVRQIKELCVMIEDRFKELTGKFDLNHGAYFRDPRILGVIAHFLEFRELPEWSKAIDTDVMRAEHMVHSS
ncbi:unnamed protein product [Closterium sp. NIES-64]|nr:unnamed protein product [Closterium sp. NIES-64]